MVGSHRDGRTGTKTFKLPSWEEANTWFRSSAKILTADKERLIGYADKI